MVDARAAIAIIGLFLVAPRAGIGQVKASLAKVDFGAVAVGSTATASVTLTADEDLPRFSLELEAPFGLLVPPPPSLYASHPMTIWLTFTPTSQSAFHSVLELGGLKIELLGTGFGGTRATATGAPAAVRAAAGTPRPAGGLVFGNAAAAAATGIAQPAAAGLAVDAATRTIILGRGQQSGTATVTVSDVLGVAIGSVAAPAPVADVFSVSSTCPNHPADATTCTITATATLTSGGYAGEVVEILSPAGEVLAKTSFDAVDNFSVFSSGASTIAFGGVSVGDTAAKSVVVTNYGMAAAALAIASSPAGSFATQGCNGLISGQCALEVSYAPSQQIAETGTISMQPSDGGPPIDLPVSGTGLPSKIAVGPPTVAFSGAQGEVQEVAITNPTSRQVAIAGVTVNGPFSESTPCATLAPGESCAISVQFAPSAAQGGLAASGQLSVTSTNPTLISAVGLTAAAYGPALAVDRSSIQFGAQEIGAAQASQQIVVANRGEQATSIGVQSAGDFNAAPACTQLDPGASCAIRLSFSPSAAGSRSGIAVISGAGASLTVGLSGEGLQPPSKPDRDLPINFGAGVAGGFALSLPSLFERTKAAVEGPGIGVAPSVVALGGVAAGANVGVPVTISELAGHDRHLLFALSGPFEVTGCAILKAHSKCVAVVTSGPGAADGNGVIVVTESGDPRPLAVVGVKYGAGGGGPIGETDCAAIATQETVWDPAGFWQPRRAARFGKC